MPSIMLKDNEYVRKAEGISLSKRSMLFLGEASTMEVTLAKGIEHFFAKLRFHFFAVVFELAGGYELDQVQEVIG